MATITKLFELKADILLKQYIRHQSFQNYFFNFDLTNNLGHIFFTVALEDPVGDWKITYYSPKTAVASILVMSLKQPISY